MAFQYSLVNFPHPQSLSVIGCCFHLCKLLKVINMKNKSNKIVKLFYFFYIILYLSYKIVKGKPLFAFYFYVPMYSWRIKQWLRVITRKNKSPFIKSLIKTQLFLLFFLLEFLTSMSSGTHKSRMKKWRKWWKIC